MFRFEKASPSRPPLVLSPHSSRGSSADFCLCFSPVPFLSGLFYQVPNLAFTKQTVKSTSFFCFFPCHLRSPENLAHRHSKQEIPKRWKRLGWHYLAYAPRGFQKTDCLGFSSCRCRLHSVRPIFSQRNNWVTCLDHSGLCAFSEARLLIIKFDTKLPTKSQYKGRKTSVSNFKDAKNQIPRSPFFYPSSFHLYSSTDIQTAGLVLNCPFRFIIFLYRMNSFILGYKHMASTYNKRLSMNTQKSSCRNTIINNRQKCICALVMSL